MTSKSLIPMIHMVADIEASLIEGEGLLTPEIEAMLEIKEIKIPEKVDGYAFIWDRIELAEAYHKARAAEAAKNAKVIANFKENFKNRLKFAMEELGTKELRGNDFLFRLQATNPKVIIDDEDAIHDAYKTVKTETVINKAAIAKDIKADVPFAGAHLEMTPSLRKYSNTSIETKGKKVTV